ncbi:hypothetical protein DVW87_14485 [Sphingomonas aracearum]|uniref:Uncharacterized protein n=2 Tax=Sphingomonas aracearum TaxID=2283317 RepID=A0A369VVD9_9SPHN|nr:hypothetical protein DVW87_14485 [Sphingomonas aracearum]
MAAVLAIGFGLNFALGRSSFGAPASVHLHALLFVGWTGLYVLQTGLAATGSLALHRRLGWLAVGWLPAMVLAGTYVTVMSVRREAVPFFSTPGYFLIMNPLGVLTFAGLSGAAMVLRRRTQWHRRLMLCGMAVLTGPGWGRFAPVPLLIPHAGLGVIALVLLFPLAGMLWDLRSRGRVHPAWWWGIGTILAMQVLIEIVPATPLGGAIYRAAAAGSPAAGHDRLAYPPFPPGFPIPHP